MKMHTGNKKDDVSLSKEKHDGLEQTVIDLD